jgi:carbamate kinase
MTATRADRWVIAIGGNALANPRDPTDLARQEQHARDLAEPIADALASGVHLAIVHGNGPQVGARLIENEAAPTSVPRKQLHTLVAETQGELGHYLALALIRALRRRKIDRGVAALVTHVLVDPAAPEFAHPEKPVGPTYSPEMARALEQQSGWQFLNVSGGGRRRVVPSPRPRAILEEGAVQRLVDDDWCVIAGGGGGVPIAETASGLEGVDAVVDKDYVAAHIATGLGAQRLVILTDVAGAALSFEKPTQRFLDRMTAADARMHLARGEFAPGSMAPKVEACVEFIEHGGDEAVIASVVDAARAFAGGAGTRIASNRNA